ncbi:hypothetical protein DFH08DRAFT_804777 [Mycena albidolilacea]|uniref:Uncharacterized protein n=1 Tax=Mycena albidolilacea TaxID=1033008 RepID=A0AAD7AB30_9AGAR|nr:hypothetical protein DFH08DRAFT_804777 [Mycena albidolilacea]
MYSEAVRVEAVTVAAISGTAAWSYATSYRLIPYRKLMFKCEIVLKLKRYIGSGGIQTAHLKILSVIVKTATQTHLTTLANVVPVRKMTELLKADLATLSVEFGEQLGRSAEKFWKVQLRLEGDTQSDGVRLKIRGRWVLLGIRRRNHNMCVGTPASSEISTPPLKAGILCEWNGKNIMAAPAHPLQCR